MLMTFIYASRLLWIMMLLPATSLILLVMNNNSVLINWQLMSLLSCEVTIPILLDLRGTLFSLTVMFISANVLHFSSSYMDTEKFPARFNILVLLFILSMNLLIYIPHLISLLIGWDGLGIISFALVIYYQNPKSLGAGMITALMNRIGDVMIILSIALLLNLAHWNIMTLWNWSSAAMCSLFILIASMTKSAQIPFSSWLPAAMAAPTPVSALVHSSTLVTAGIFLIIRFHYFLSSFTLFNPILLIIAATTMFMAGSAAMAECDMKKIIALSTLSQLGMMMSCLGLGMTNLAFFHLLTHALFKALLFLTAGSMIYHFLHAQDLRQMGIINISNPLLTSSLTIANLSLCGSPFLAGFYSKDLILESSLFIPLSSAAMFLLFSATALTAMYSLRMMMVTVWAPANMMPMTYSSDNDNNITTPIIMLTIATIIAGSWMMWLFFSMTQEMFLPMHFKMLTTTTILLGILFTLLITSSASSFLIKTPTLNFSLTMMWFLSPSMSQGMMSQSLIFMTNIIKTIDHGWMELAGAQGISTYMTSMSNTALTPHKSFISSALSLSLLILALTLSMI